MIEKIVGFNKHRILIAIALIAILSAFQNVKEVKTVMFIVSVYIVLVFLWETFKIIREWFT